MNKIKNKKSNNIKIKGRTKLLSSFFLFFLLIQNSWAQNPMVFTVDVSITNSLNTAWLTLPGVGGGNYDIDFDYDGITFNPVLSSQTGMISMNYTLTSGIFQVGLRGDYGGIPFAFSSPNIVSLEQWGDLARVRYDFFLSNRNTFVNNATDQPNMSNVISTNDMFNGASAFNMDVSSWDTRSLVTANNMFKNSPIDPDVSSWDFTNVTSLSGFFEGSGISTANYDKALISFDASGLTGINLGTVPSSYCSAAAVAARANLITKGWTISDSGVCVVSFTIDAITAASIAENTAYTGVVPNITGSPVGAVTYSLSGSDAGLFTIATATGIVSMIGKDFEIPIDTDTDNVYELGITATDSNGNTAIQSWQVTVTNVVEVVSFTIDAITAASIVENTAYTGVVPNITGSPVGAVAYSLSGSDAGLFTIATATGIVSMIGRDFESPSDTDTDNVYELSITATDSDGNTAIQSWQVTVTNVVEVVSFTIDAITAASIVENTAYTGVVPNITGSPVGAVTYSLSGSDAGLFTIATATGVVSMIGKDFEIPTDTNTDNVYELGITATDSDGNTAIQSWQVTVTNVVEVVSFTIDAITAASIAENTAYTGVVPNITGSPVGAVTYSLSGSDAGLFTIATATGVVSMIGRDFESPADADADNVYDLTITATDSDGNTAIQSWQVTVTNVVEVVSFTIDAITAASIVENTAYTGVVPNITGSPVGAVTYSLSGSDAGLFTIATATGVVSMIGKDFEIPTDTDTDNVYELSITATDSDGNTAIQSWQVTVTNVVEVVSFTIDAITAASIVENTAYTGVVPNITGSPVGAVAYSLSGSDAGLFTIATVTGIVSMIGRDFESPSDTDTDNVYELSITATDSDGNTAIQSWQVTVTNVVEAVSFTIDAITAASIVENTAYTGVVPNITGSPVGAVAYSLSGSDAGLFTIATATGIVSMIGRDFESPSDTDTDNVYELSITATDSDGNTAIQSWQVTVTNVVEVVSFTIDAITAASIVENTAYTGVVPNITGSPVGAVTYSLSGSDAGLFTIATATGVVSMIGKDFEIPTDTDTDNVYELSITATDSDGNTAIQSWQVTVTNVVEVVSFTIDAITAASIVENTAYTGVVPNITGSPVGAVAYSLSGSDAGLFTIATVTGIVSMIGRDFESPSDTDTDNVYELSITATDSDGNTAIQSWQVTVTNVVEVVSFTIDAITAASIVENTAYTGVVPNITGSPVGAVTYSLSGSDAGLFTIATATGVVSMIGKDFEIPTDTDTDNVYELSITATDSDGNTAIQSWQVTVTNVVEAVSFTIDAITAASIVENTAYTGVVPNITGSPVGAVAYSLSGSDAGLFTIATATGIVSMIGRDFESPSDTDTDNVYELSITATDSDGNTAIQSWQVTVTNVVEVVSFTIDAITAASIVENTAYTGVVPNITGSPVGAVTYSLSGSDAGLFTIATATGVVSMIGKDFEIPTDTDTDNVYELSITATDSDGNTAIQSWQVTVTNVVEVVSFTIDAITAASIVENTAYTGVVPNITGSPVGAVTYSLSGSDAGLFTIATATGIVSMIGRDFESPSDTDTDNVYELSITATDSDGNTAIQSWQVTVTNVVEVVSFTIDAITAASIVENTAYTGVVPNITGSPVGAVTYSLSGSDAGLFTIATATGVVSMIGRDFESPADADADNVYDLTITATDSDGNTASESWTLTITNIVETASFTIAAISNVNLDENTAYTGVTPNIIGIPIGVLTYSLGGVDATLFTIDAATGIVGMSSKDFENPLDIGADNVYELSITVTDSDGNTANESWTVTMIDDIVEDSINALTEVLESSSSIGGSSNANGVDVSLDILNSILGLTGVDAGSLAIYQALIALETSFSTPPELTEIQAIIDAANSSGDIDGDGITDVLDPNPTNPDTDGDGITDGADVDIDGDGIADNGIDTDGDGINDISDVDVDGDGIADNGTDMDGDGITDSADTDIDGDGLVNTLDPDPTNPDTDGDGITDGADVDVDGNGIADNGIDTDGDGINDISDVDVDGDGIADNGTDMDGDGITDSADTDIDGDGLVNTLDPDPTNPDTDGDGITDGADVDVDGDGIADNGIDTDGDGINDISDVDVDGDGIADNGTDMDGDGITDSADTDIDGDGLVNTLDPDPTNPDTDGDGITDGADVDVDGDGIADNGIDTDGDGINDISDVDVDGDGIADNGTDMDGDGITDSADTDIDGDGLVNTLDPNSTNPDTDGDGIADGADVDVDGNGIADNGIDTDGDGINDISDVDVDGDGIADNGTDMDGDGITDSADTDIDGDGLVNTLDPDSTNPDTDGDGITDGADVDVDGDGIADNGIDTDGDGINDISDVDVDGDGIADNGTDMDGDGITDSADTDIDGDGLVNTLDPDSTNPDTDGDGITDGADVDVDGNGIADNGIDTDGDGINDISDVDVDGDGITDNGTDMDGDGITDSADTDIDGDGLVNTLDPDPTNPDTDGDGITDGADVDVDGNGIADNGIDTDGDGINDISDVDVDGDGIADNGTDMDGDGITDSADTDIDGDGLVNTLDPDPTNPDTDGDGITDGADVDVDGDGIADNGIDTDGDGINDISDVDVDGDGIADNGTDMDGDGITDSADTDIDGDGLVNTLDPDSTNPDTDGDGITDGADVDVDGDGIADNGIDTDGDGINDISDVDVDGDGIADNGTDMDGDGITDSADTDIDGDGLVNTLDPDSTNPDTDGDGIADGADVDVDGDGIADNGIDTDGDGINDLHDTEDNSNKPILVKDAIGTKNGHRVPWVISGLESYESNKVMVFNRNSKVVFETNMYQNNWLGTYKGDSNVLPEGSYYYQIVLINDLKESKMVSGWLYIFK